MFASVILAGLFALARAQPTAFYSLTIGPLPASDFDSAASPAALTLAASEKLENVILVWASAVIAETIVLNPGSAPIYSCAQAAKFPPIKPPANTCVVAGAGAGAGAPFALISLTLRQSPTCAACSPLDYSEGALSTTLAGLGARFAAAVPGALLRFQCASTQSPCAIASSPSAPPNATASAAPAASSGVPARVAAPLLAALAFSAALSVILFSL